MRRKPGLTEERREVFTEGHRDHEGKVQKAGITFFFVILVLQRFGILFFHKDDLKINAPELKP
jgi:hypothetical protein